METETNRLANAAVDRKLSGTGFYVRTRERQVSKLELMALKAFPGSPVQTVLRERIDAIRNGGHQ